MKCELCDSEHAGLFGSGRFCNMKCAKSFSTKEKRQDINLKVSEKAKANRSADRLNSLEIRNKRDTTMLERYGTTGILQEHVLKGVEIRNNNCLIRRQDVKNFESFSIKVKKKILIEELGHKCSECSLETWLNKPIPLELDHIDGNHNNNLKSNFRLLCANCHAFTPTYRRSKNAYVA